MKTLLRAICTLSLLFLAVFVFAQTIDTTGLDAYVPFDGDITVDELKTNFNLIFSALVIIWGYVAKAFGLKTQKTPFVLVVLAGAAVLAGLFLAMGWSQAIPLAISFLLSLGLFDTIFKPIERIAKRRELTPVSAPSSN